jgi:hypothetical protein
VIAVATAVIVANPCYAQPLTRAMQVRHGFGFVVHRDSPAGGSAAGSILGALTYHQGRWCATALTGDEGD